MDATVLSQNPNSSEAELAEAVHWVDAHKAEIPEAVFKVVMMVATLRAELLRTKARATKLLELFRQAMGVSPKSERGGTSPKPGRLPPKTDAERLAALKARLGKIHKEIRRYEERLGIGRKRRQKKAGSNKAHAVAGPSAPEFQRSGEALFTGNLATPSATVEPKKVDRIENFENPRGLHAVSDERTRHEFGFQTKTITLQVETVTDPRTGKSVTASTDDVGPPNSQATWNGIAAAVMAIIGYAIPINRLAAILTQSNPYFTSSRLCSHLKMAAEYFAPIYTYLGESLSDADVLQGDDTKTRVIEINKALKETGEVKAVGDDTLIGRIASVFGRVFPRKNRRGNKRSLNVSVVIGKTNAFDPRSYVFFFRTHLGSLGDLLTKMLEMRDPKKKMVTILTDMATTNLVAPKLYEKFTIIHAGCGPHARRPFFRRKDTDHGLCYWMLSAFLILEQIEDRLDELGRTRERILRYRQRYSRKIWRAILKRCHEVLRGDTSRGQYWPKTSELYGACEYVVKHYEALTRYLDDPRLPSNNNLCERVLRWDKIMQDASKFRMTEQGRLHVDILRTIVHTCSAAGIELRDYLLFVFLNRTAIEADPSQFTPYAYALRCEQQAAKGVQKTLLN